jgi:hypothetical protein
MLGPDSQYSLFHPSEVELSDTIKGVIEQVSRHTPSRVVIDSLASPLDISYLADTVIMLRFFEANGAVHKAISVVKKRTGGHEHTIREFEITDTELRVGPPLTAFRGVLTGVPEYNGDAEPLFEGRARVSPS